MVQVLRKPVQVYALNGIGADSMGNHTFLNWKRASYKVVEVFKKMVLVVKKVVEV